MTSPCALRRIAAGLACCVALAFAAKADDRTAASPPSATLHVDPGPCSLDLPSGGFWSETEKAIFFGLCAGWDGVIDLSELDRNPLACNPHDIEGDVPPHRVISGRFIEALGKDGALHDTLARSLIHIKCAKVVGVIRFDFVDIPLGLVIDQTWFTSPVSFHAATIAHTLSFTGSTFDERVNLERIRVGDYLHLRDGGTYKGEVRLLNAEISAHLEATGSTFEGLFNADGMQVGGSVFLRGGATFKEEVRLLSADIGSNLDAAGSTFKGPLDGGGMQVGGSVFLRGGATFKEEVRLLNADIGSNLEADGSTFKGPLDGGGMQVGGSVFLRGGATFEGRVQFWHAAIGGNLETDGSSFRNSFDGSGTQIAGSLNLRRGAKFDGEVNLIGVRVGKFLNIAEGMFKGTVDLTGANITNELLLSSERHGQPLWGEDARLILRNVTTDSLQAEIMAWKTTSGNWIQGDLRGLRYGRLGGLHAGTAPDNPNMADAEVSTLIDWLWMTRPDPDARHDKEPYEHLATVLELQGAPSKAREVRYAMHDQHRQASDISFSHKTALWALKTSVGYGLYPFRVVWWFFGLVVLGALLGALSSADALKNEQNGTKPWWSWILFSLGNAFPLMSPISRFDGISHNNDLVEFLFQVQRLLGFVIATIFIGALTLLAI